jgi:hypothetical protein
VKNNLAQAGFTNIRIMPESFLVRATDRDGNPVMMLINPDSITEVTAAAGDQDNATSQAEQGQTISKSAKMTNNQANSGTNEATEEDRGNSQSAKMRAGGSSQNTENGNVPGWPPQGRAVKMPETGPNQSTENANVPGWPKQAAATDEQNPPSARSSKMSAAGSNENMNGNQLPGRANGMVAELKDQGQSLQLSVAQRAEIWRTLGSKAGETAPAGFQPKVGETVPNGVQLKSLPSKVSNDVPAVRSYQYAMLHSQLLLVDPSTKKIVAVITE